MKKFLMLFIVLLLTGCTEINNNSNNNQQLSDDLLSCGNPFIDNWTIVWCDEFDYRGLPDQNKWDYDIGGHGWGNNELQYYTNRSENAYVDDGVLTITALKESFENRDYTSARLVTKNHGDWLYGRIEVKAKLPEGRGTWPAIWMLPTDWEYGGWPDSGEIDIMEHVGYDMNVIHGTVHTKNKNHMLGTQVGKSITLDDVVNTYHVYAIEWEPNAIKFFVDGEKYFEFNNNEISNPDNSYGNWPFDKRFHLILNIAIGGFWGGAQGVDPDLSTAQMIVDYVRVYEKDYSSIDEETPSNVSNIYLDYNLPSKTVFSWDEATDDIGVKLYEVYVNDELITTTNTTFVVLNQLDSNTNYTLKVVSVDFANKSSNGIEFPFTTGEYPTLPVKIEAEDYEVMEGIQTEDTVDSGGGLNVGWFDKDDYLLYTIKVEQTSAYKINARIASDVAQASFSFYDDDSLLTEFNFTDTGGWQNWTSIESDVFTLEAGVHTIKLEANSGGFNINWFEFVEVSE